jgi:hypothetical protein
VHEAATHIFRREALEAALQGSDVARLDVTQNQLAPVSGVYSLSMGRCNDARAREAIAAARRQLGVPERGSRIARRGHGHDHTLAYCVRCNMNVQ